MPLVAHNGALIVKGGTLAENCNCCGDGWYCYNAQCGCSLTVVDGKIYLPISVTMTDGRRTYNQNIDTIPFVTSQQQAIAVYGTEGVRATVSNPYVIYSTQKGGTATGYDFGVEGRWRKQLYYPPFIQPRPQCCGPVTEQETAVSAVFSCLQDAWRVSWYAQVFCAEWRYLFEGEGYVGYPTYGDGGTFLVPKNDLGLPQAGTHLLHSGSPNVSTIGGPACDYSFITGASMTIL